MPVYFYLKTMPVDNSVFKKLEDFVFIAIRTKISKTTLKAISQSRKNIRCINCIYQFV